MQHLLLDILQLVQFEASDEALLDPKASVVSCTVDANEDPVVYGAPLRILLLALNAVSIKVFLHSGRVLLGQVAFHSVATSLSQRIEVGGQWIALAKERFSTRKKSLFIFSEGGRIELILSFMLKSRASGGLFFQRLVDFSVIVKKVLFLL